MGDITPRNPLLPLQSHPADAADAAVGPVRPFAVAAAASAPRVRCSRRRWAAACRTCRSPAGGGRCLKTGCFSSCRGLPGRRRARRVGPTMEDDESDVCKRNVASLETGLLDGRNATTSGDAFDEYFFAFCQRC